MRFSWLALVAGCWTGGSAPAPVSPPRVETAAVETCAVTPPVQTAQQLVAVRWLGQVGERTYAIAEGRGGQPLLASLAGGALALVPLPVPIEATHVADGHLWVFGARQLVDVDLASSPPAIHVQPWNPAPLGRVDAIAVSEHRVLVASVTADQLAFQLYDRANVALGLLTTIRSTAGEVPELRCAGDRCFAIGISGHRQSRRPFVERFDAAGGAQLELLGDEPVAELHTARLGARTAAVWTSVKLAGLFARSVDATGRPDMARTLLAGLPVAPVRFELLHAIPPRIAARGVDDLWTAGVLELDQHRIDDARLLPLGAAMPFFAGAVTDEGVIGAGYATTVVHLDGFHTWRATARATFLPSPRGLDADPPVDVVPGGWRGDGRAGMAAFPLVEPGHAAVLVVPTGPEAQPGGALFRLRRPCSP